MIFFSLASGLAKAEMVVVTLENNLFFNMDKSCAFLSADIRSFNSIQHL